MVKTKPTVPCSGKNLALDMVRVNTLIALQVLCHWDFSGSPAAKTLHSQSREPEFDSCSETRADGPATKCLHASMKILHSAGHLVLISFRQVLL